MSNLIGQSLGRYHILEQLGEGGMATVYKAYDTRLERDVAVKIIRTDQFAPAMLDRILKRFEREAKALAKLSHPNIVKVLDFGDYEGSPYLVMEYLPGGTLKQRLGRPIPWQEAARLLLPVASALQFAHEQGIVHRDVKPSNILITRSGEPMLSDFGIAKILESEETVSLTGTGVGVGTPEYMSPEQGLGKEIDARADVYSLGIIFYELVTGRKPFTADTPMAVVIKHINDPLPRPTRFVPDLPAGVERVLLRTLAKQPENRYPDMEAFAQALETLPAAPVQDIEKTIDQAAEEEATRDILEAAATKIPKPAAGQKPRPQRSLLKWLPLIGIAAFLCLFLATGGGYLIWRSINGPLAANPTEPLSSPTKSIPLTVSLTPSVALTFTPPAIVTLTSSATPTLEMTSTLSETPPPSAGSILLSLADGMEMVYVPAGDFLMGAAAGAQYANPNEMPQHTVYLDAFWMDRTEVTNGMFALFVQATGYKTDAERIGNGTVLDFDQAGSPWIADMPGVSWRHPHSPSDDITGLDVRPVVQVSWNDASAYCQWASRRLPTEAEWEKAARGADGRLYPWGNDAPSANLLNFNRLVGHLTDVGSYPAGASPYGALDMLGNAYEWVFDRYDSSYYSHSPGTNPQGPGSGSLRIIRGGAWNYGLDWTRATSRSKLEPTYRVETLGFRCASDANP